MRIIKIETCSDCPVVVRECGGLKAVCGHPKVRVKRPYPDQRIVKLKESPPEFCVLDKLPQIGVNKINLNHAK